MKIETFCLLFYKIPWKGPLDRRFRSTPFTVQVFVESSLYLGHHWEIWPSIDWLEIKLARRQAKLPILAYSISGPVF